MFDSSIKLSEALLLALSYMVFVFVGYLMGRYFHKEA